MSRARSRACSIRRCCLPSSRSTSVVLGTSDPTTVGRWLRLSSFVVFVAYGLRRPAVPAIVPAARARAARDAAVAVLLARLVPVRRAVPGSLVRRRHDAVPDLRAARGGPRACGPGLRVCARFVRAADRRHRGLRRVGARQPDQAPVPGGADPRAAGAHSRRWLASLCGVGRAERRVRATPRTNTSVRPTCSTTSATPATSSSEILSRRRRDRSESRGASSATLSTCRCMSARR